MEEAIKDTKSRRQWLALGFGLLLMCLLWWINPLGLEEKACRLLAIAGLMITWWIGEAMPMPVVALLPLVLFPVLGIARLDAIAPGYASPVIFLFMGGFLIGLAIEKWSLHRRIALSIVSLTGTSGNRIILGFILATGLLSMWLSNTATAMMMYPIGISVIQVIKTNHKSGGNTANFSLCIMLSIAYAANLGGIATIIGTPPNVTFVEYIRKHYNYNIQFIDWMLVCTPLAIALLFSAYFVMVKWLFPNRMGSDTATGELIQNEIRQLGPLSAAEIGVLIIFILTALLWMIKDPLNKLAGTKLDDTMIALMGAILLFIVPSGAKPSEGSAKLLVWQDTSKMAWGILLLFGGGITLADALDKAGLIERMGKWLGTFTGNDILVLIIVVAVVSIFLSEVMSNVAQVMVLAPVITGLSDELKFNPLILGLAMTLAASCASMLPMGTPPNAIVFASGHIRIGQMIRAGLIINIISIILITLFCLLILPLVMPEVSW